MVRKGRHAFGGRNPVSRLTDEMVLAARRRYATGTDTMDGLAAEFMVDYAAMNAALKGKTWRHVGGPLAPRRRLNTKLTEAQVIDLLAVRGRVSAGSVANKLGVRAEHIRRLWRGEGWSYLRR